MVLHIVPISKQGPSFSPACQDNVIVVAVWVVVGVAVSDWGAPGASVASVTFTAKVCVTLLARLPVPLVTFMSTRYSLFVSLSLGSS